MTPLSSDRDFDRVGRTLREEKLVSPMSGIGLGGLPQSLRLRNAETGNSQLNVPPHSRRQLSK
jgi:hypothetical protein